MTPSRRQLLSAAAAGGAALIVAPAVAGGWRAWEAGLVGADPAPFDPWTRLGAARPGDPVALVAAAVLSPNPHNTQPWRFHVEADRITLSADPARHLGSFDPFRREMWTGIGCAVETLVQAGPSLGFEVHPVLAPASADSPPQVEIALAARAPAADGALDSIEARRTNRAPYAAKPITGEALERLRACAASGPSRLTLIDGASPEGRRFAEATLDATRAINADATMSADSHRWFRPNARATAAHRDGVSVPTAGLGGLMTVAGQMLPEPDAAAAGGYWLASTRRQVEGGAPLFGLIAVDDLYDRASQVEAGRLWQRLHLAATRLGLAAQPLNQLPEVVDRDRQLGRPARWPARVDAFSQAGGRVTFAFRMGHPATQPPHAARRPVAAVLV